MGCLCYEIFFSTGYRTWITSHLPVKFLKNVLNYEPCPEFVGSYNPMRGRKSRRNKKMGCHAKRGVLSSKF